VRTLRIYRFNPDQAATALDTFELEAELRPMVLDALIQIQSHVDSSLTFRRFVPQGMRLVLHEHQRRQPARLHHGTRDLAAEIRIYPLPHLPV